MCVGSWLLYAAACAIGFDKVNVCGRFAASERYMQLDDFWAAKLRQVACSSTAVIDLYIAALT